MQDRTNPANWPNSRGPWHEVSDLSRLHDHGAAWCLNADGHPDPEDGYPDPAIHVPFDECRTFSFFAEEARAGLVGPPLGLSVYGARRFRFGEPRDGTMVDRARIILGIFDPTERARPVRCSLLQGEALLLGRQIDRLVDLLND